MPITPYTINANSSTTPIPPFPPNVPEAAQFTDLTNGNVYLFPFNINSLNFNYQLNTQSYSTLGGRVTQILSVQITTLTVQGEAGSRQNLINLYNAFTNMQDNQNSLKSPMKFDVPSRGLSFNVWLENFQKGWGVTTVAYEYQFMLEVDQDLTGLVTQSATSNALNHLVNNDDGQIGFSGEWTGLSTTAANFQYVDIQNAIKSGALVPNTPSTSTGP